ncbi:MAG TPA: ATP-binding protein [Tepidisphaeraceae bacterium]|nr:ATP-binding protein [Tepidisphaeraceae bacterium]
MQIEASNSKATAARQRLLLRGESVVASAGIALAALLLVAMAASAWWIHVSQRGTIETTRAAQAQTGGDQLARATEVLLSRDELSAVRTLVANAGRAWNFSECQIVLPDGQVLASMDAARITAKRLPETWPAGQQPEASRGNEHGIVRVACPMDITGKGHATLQITAPVNYGSWSDWQMQAGIGGIGAIALFALLLIYRRMRGRLRALGAIREALLLAGGGSASPQALALSTELGPEARAWNDVVADIEKLRRQNVADRVKETLGQRHEVRNELESVCDALAQGLLLIDDRNHIRYANGAAAVLLRAKREDLLGGDVSKFIEVDSVLEAVREVAGGAARKRFTLDVERQEDGANGVLRFAVRPVRRDDKASAMLTIEDITQQRVAEEARHSFVAQATHELRTPLTNIRLYVETAIEEGENNPATRARCLNVINGEARRLERIVGEMLSVAEIEAGSFKLNQDDVRIEAVFAELQADFQQQAEEKKIALKFNLPPKLPQVRGDRDKIVLALHNLVGNALKYTPDGGKVSVGLDAGDGQLAVHVKDTGFGISRDDQEKVFERFYRANDPRVAKITGTGLGLTLAREVARLHGGDITIDSELNRGSTFTFVMPVMAKAA